MSFPIASNKNVNASPNAANGSSLFVNAFQYLLVAQMYPIKRTDSEHAVSKLW